MRKSLFLITIGIIFTHLLPSVAYSQSCTNWLYVAPGANASVRIGDLDIPGQQVTVEATFCRTSPYDPIFHGGDLVSKHVSKFDVNYLLRPNLACVTTNTGYYEVNAPCPIDLNVTYHVAMVYDGSTLTLYRNGVLLDQVAANGDLYQQDFQTAIGFYAAQYSPSSFNGYINEVRIWKVARTQADIQANMSSSLPSPATQPGLVAYYTFDNALNKQGTPAWDGVLSNGPLLNQTNPYCTVTKATGTTGTLTGSNTCNGAPGLLTFHSQAGPGPFTLVYSDGLTTYTQAGVFDGTPFPVQIQPTVPTTYTLISIQDATNCPVFAIPGITTTINPGLCTLCSGSLGDPIINATFGSGNGNSPPLETVIPGASTNLIYQPTSGVPATPTPLDGYYTISSTVPVNSSGAYWFTGGKDHTGDPNGYMLYENPGTSTGEFFRQKMTTLCGGGKYEFSAWIAQSDDPRTVPGIVSPDLTFIVQTEDGTVLDTYNSGPVPVLFNWTWNHYGFFFTLPPGITTAIVRILDNSAGGTNVHGNDFALDDITFRPCGPVMTASLAVGQPPSVCPGDQVTLAGLVSGGYANPAYLWQVSADSGKTWTDLPNSNNTQLTTTAPSAGKAIDYHYRMLAAEASNIQSPACRVASNDIILKVGTGAGTDFGFVQQTCNPLEYRFNGTALTGITYNWTIDGTDFPPATGQSALSLFYSFPAYGDHTVTLTTTGSCSAATSRTITVALQPAEILLTADSGICAGSSVVLKTKAGPDFCWSPVTGLSDPTSPNPIARPAVTTKYHYTSLITGTNLVVNGDFSAGNTGFSSAYTYATNGSPAGMYGIGPNPATWLPNASPCKDHTSGAGNMLLINGADLPDVQVWSETVTIQPNTNYDFSAWLESITSTNPATLQFSINGLQLGTILTANANDCIWNQFHTSWNSGNNTTAIISIVNENISFSGNDFALDDITFAPVTMQTDSVTIDVETPVVTAIPATATVCPGMPLQLQASGSLHYTWSPASGLDDPSLVTPIFQVPASRSGTTITYTVTGTSARGCTASNTLNVSLLPLVLTLGASNPLICHGDGAQLYASGGGTYNWSPANLLDNPASAVPIAKPDVTTRFYLSLTDINNCAEKDSLTIQIKPAPLYKAPPDESVCTGFNVKLASTNSPGYIYAWTPATGLDNPAAPVPYASPDATIIYSLHISDSVCTTYDSSFDVEVVVKPSPFIIAEKNNDIDCAVHTAQLGVSGGLSYQWSPAQGLNNPYSPTPIASVDTSTTYIVRGTGSNGCYAYDTLTVNVTATGANTFVVPNAFTPNGDGHNDCFRVSQWGDVQLEEFAVYNRWGQRVFSTRNPSECWDGTFAGQSQESGTYVYIIRAHTYCGEITRKGTVMLIR